jgi:hypothetical protein
MRKALAVAALGGIIVTAAAADPITPFSFYAGYFSSLSFNNRAGNSTHLGGIEVGASESLISLPIFGSASLGASVVFGDTLGGGATGNLYRVHLDYKSASAPGTNLYAIGAVAFNYATGSGFSNQSGLGLEAGVGFPLRFAHIGPSASLEARYRFLGPRAATGFSVGLNLSF